MQRSPTPSQPTPHPSLPFIGGFGIELEQASAALAIEVMAYDPASGRFALFHFETKPIATSGGSSPKKSRSASALLPRRLPYPIARVFLQFLSRPFPATSRTDSNLLIMSGLASHNATLTHALLLSLDRIFAAFARLLALQRRASFFPFFSSTLSAQDWPILCKF
jgi:hypothetical protein